MTHNEECPPLSKGWAWATLRDISEINPKFIGNNVDDNIEVTFLPMRAVEEKTSKTDLSLSKKIREVKKSYTPFKNGDILFAKITPCMENGKIAIADNLKNGIGFGSTEFHVLRLDNSIERKLVFFFLLQDGYRKEAQRNMTGSAGQLRVPVYFIENTRFPLPPLPEQHRIVAKIEELFTKLDAGVEALKKAKAQLKHYRQAVLKAAMEGKLTEKWREAHKGELEPASALLGQIKEERRKKWLAEGTRKFNDFSLVDTKGLPELAEGWVWTSIGNICDLINGRAFKPRDWSSHGLPIVRIQNLNNINEKFNYCNFEVEDKYLIDNGQLLFAWSGTPRTSFGAHIWNRERAVLNQHIFRVEINESCISKIFLMHLINYKISEYIRKAHGTAGLAHITKGKFEGSLLPLPPFPEQQKIVEEIEQHFSVVEHMEKTMEQNLRQAERLRQSILKRAFEGKLVPQDPTDESASVLLERIKEEKVKQEAKEKGKKRGKRNPKQRRFI